MEWQPIETAPDEEMVQTVYRVQDAEGRGPYRPGFSHTWKDPEHDFRNPSIFDDFPTFNPRRLPNGFAYGCAFRTIGHLTDWFSSRELGRLALMGYRVVQIDVENIIAESPRQVIVARRRPLRIGATEVNAPLVCCGGPE